jgi:hypothetical protein
MPSNAQCAVKAGRRLRRQARAALVALAKALLLGSAPFAATLRRGAEAPSLTGGAQLGAHFACAC